MPVDLMVSLSGGIKECDSQLEQANKTLRLATHVSEEIVNVLKKANSITSIGNQPVSVTRLELTGKNTVDKITLTYIVNGNSLRTEYSERDFYAL